MITPDYECFFNNKVEHLIEWCFEEKDRIKSSKIYKAACKMEQHYRKREEIPDDATKIYGNGCVLFGTPFLLYEKMRHILVKDK